MHGSNAGIMSVQIDPQVRSLKRQRADVRHNLNEIQLVQQFILLSVGGR